MNIYIVEDELFHLEDLKITVESLGHRCVGHAADPFDALEGIDQHEPDVVLIDVHLQGKQAGIALGRDRGSVRCGITACRRARCDCAQATRPFCVGLTGLNKC